MTEEHRQTRRDCEATGAAVGDGPPPAAFPARLKDKVALVGFADGHRHLAPFNNPEFEIWGLNRLHAVLPGRYDRWLEIHDIGMYLGEDYQDDSGGGHREADTQHLEFLRTFPGPVYLRPQDMGRILCPSAQPYPMADILSMFRPNYFTNSISWMLALAIAMGYREIHLYGVDMAQDQLFSAEYRQQRPSCEWLIGWAQGRGITIGLPPGCDLLKADHLYGLESNSPMMLKNLSRMKELGVRKEQVKKALADLEAQKAAVDKQWIDQKIQLIAQINQMDGAMGQVQYQLVNLSAPPEHEPETRLV